MSSDNDKLLARTKEPKVSSCNNNNQQDEVVLPKHWTKVASKKHPGKHYYFNVSTKESLWEHPGKTKALEEDKSIQNLKAPKGTPCLKSEKVIHLKNIAQFKKKNLANDRLEKLKRQLELERRQEAAQKIAFKKVEKETKTPETIRKTNSPVKPVDKTGAPKQKPKRDGSNNLTEATSGSSTSKIKPTPKSKAITKTVSLKDEQKKLNEVEKSKKKDQEEPKESKNLKSFKIPKKAKLETVSSPIFVDTQKCAEVKINNYQLPKTDTPISQPKKRPVPIADEVANTSAGISYANRLPESSKNETKPSPKLTYAEKLLEAFERPQASPRTASGTVPAYTSTPKVRTSINADDDSPCLGKSPANERLAGIRKKLAEEVVRESILLDEDAEMTDLSDALAQDHDSKILAEAMDWEDIPEDVAIREVVAVRQLPLTKESILDATIPGYGTQLFEQTHFQRYVLLVIDTNVFLSHLKGVERLIEEGFPHIGQPILIVPYIVLQELDRIKHREQGKPLSQVAAHSIRFLNDYLKRHDPRIKGQSTIEASNKLIPVDNADDNIINCCLQVQQITMGIATDVMLLSNDINLRNKALVNGIQAFGYGELVAEADRIRFAADEQIAGR